LNPPEKKEKIPGAGGKIVRGGVFYETGREQNSRDTQPTGHTESRKRGGVGGSRPGIVKGLVSGGPGKKNKSKKGKADPTGTRKKTGPNWKNYRKSQGGPWWDRRENKERGVQKN